MKWLRDMEAAVEEHEEVEAEDDEDVEWFEVEYERVFVKKTPSGQAKGWGWVVKGQRVQVRPVRFLDDLGQSWVELTLFELWRSCNVRSRGSRGFSLIDGAALGLGRLLRGPLRANECPGAEWEDAAGFMRWWPLAGLPPVLPGSQGGAWTCRWRGDSDVKLHVAWTVEGREMEVSGPLETTCAEVCALLEIQSGLGAEYTTCLFRNCPESAGRTVRMGGACYMAEVSREVLCAVTRPRPRLHMERATFNRDLEALMHWMLAAASPETKEGAVNSFELDWLTPSLIGLTRRVVLLNDRDRPVAEPVLTQVEKLGALFEGLALPMPHVGPVLPFVLVPGDVGLQEALAEAMGLSAAAADSVELLKSPIAGGVVFDLRPSDTAYLGEVEGLGRQEAGRLRAASEILQGFGSTWRWRVKGFRCPIMYLAQDGGSLSQPVIGVLTTLQDHTKSGPDVPAGAVSRRRTSAASLPVKVVRGITGQELCKIPAREDWTVAELKDAIAGATKISRHEQRLLLLSSGVSETLRDDRQLSEVRQSQQQVSDEVTVSLVQMESRWADAMRRVEGNASVLGRLPPDLRADKDLVMAAVTSEGTALKLAAKEMRRDADVVLAAAAQDPVALELAATELWADRDFARAAAAVAGADAIRLGQEALECMAKQRRAQARATPASAEEELLAPAGAAHMDDRNLKDDREIVLAAVSSDGMALELASAQLQDDLEVALAAVRQAGRALQHVSESLRGERTVVLAAVAQDGKALRFASDALKADREVVLAAVGQTARSLHFASEELLRDKEVILAAMAKDPAMTSQLAFLARGSGVWGGP